MPKNTESRLSELLLRWEDLRAQGRPPSAEDLCRDCPEYLAEVRDRIRDLEAVYQVLDLGPGDTGRSHDTVVPGAGSWPQVPGYEILGELGAGGMGVVYQARQVGLGRLVALKMIRAGAGARPEELARFRLEAEAIAALQHPHIVQVYEVGQTDGGPFFSLEYVDGGSLERRLQGTPWPARPAAELVETLARAMHVAHQQGIVHRDLKPANILLAFSREPRASADGSPALARGSRLNDATPKITDFGLAKRLAPGDGPTRTGDVMGTPCYMAPEQAAGQTQAIGPATDIYALGAILYELLTGRPPFKGETAWETVRQVLHTEPVSLRQLQPKLPRDLETVCLKCLAKEPTRRYATALALADDLRRFRAGEPVQARPVGRLARAARWARRNPVVAGLSALAIFLLVAGTVIAGYFAVQADRRAREADAKAEEANTNAQRAQASYQLARTGLEDCVRIVADDPRVKAGPLEDLRRVVLQAKARFYQQFVALQGDEPAFQKERGRAYFRLAAVTAELGGQEEAAHHYQEAVRIFRLLATQDPATPSYPKDLADCLNNLAVLHQAAGRHQEAEQAYHDARDVRRALAERYPDVADYRAAVAASDQNLGIVLYQTGRLAEAETAYQEAAGALQALVDRDPAAATYREDLAKCHKHLALLYEHTGRFKEAEDALQSARALRHRLAEEHREVPRHAADLARIHNDLGRLYSLTGRGPDAVRAQQKAVAVQQALVDEHPAVAAYRADLASSLLNLGAAYRDSGRQAEAERASRDSVRLLQALAEQHPTTQRYRENLAKAYFNLGQSYRATGQAPDAEAAYQKALAVFQALADQAGPGSEAAVSLGNTQVMLGSLALAGGQFEAARALFARAIAMLEPLAKGSRWPQTRQLLGGAHGGRAHALSYLGRPAEALPDWERALELAADAERGALRLARAASLARLKRYAEATAEADALTASPAPGTVLYAAATVYSLAAAAVAHDTDVPAAERRRRAQAYAGQAVALLARARQAGDLPAATLAAYLEKDPALEPLRSRPDFQQLARAVTDPCPPKGP